MGKWLVFDILEVLGVARWAELQKSERKPTAT
jgi:hypothetical protein